MVAVVAGLLLAFVLLGSAAIKTVDFAGTSAALRTYGISGRVTAKASAAALIAAEAALALGVVMGSRLAASITAALFAGFALAQVGAVAAGRAGAPCACFGARGRLSVASAARVGALAILAATVAMLPRPSLSVEQWLAIGLGLTLAGLVALCVVVLALAREIGTLKLSLPAQPGALELPHEGPEIGGHSELIDFFASSSDDERLALAVFTSEGCAVCHAWPPSWRRLPVIRT